MGPSKPLIDSPLVLYCFHILATLPQDYDANKLPGHVADDSTDGASFSCGVSAESSSEKKDTASNIVKRKRDMKIDFYLSKKPRPGKSTGEQTEEADSVDSPLVNTPWKMAVLHTGTTNVHWHFIYISSHASFKSSSRLGQDIFNTRNKVEKIRCIQCLYNYLNSGDGRQVITDNMTDDVKHLTVCEKHLQEASDELLSYATEGEYEDPNLLRSLVSMRSENTTKGLYYTNDELIELFLSDRAFTESAARLTLSASPQGRNYLFKPKSNETIKIAIQTAKIIVFKIERWERAKLFYEKHQGEFNLKKQLKCLKKWLNSNYINEEDFAQTSYRHFLKQNGKKNNLFFRGPPSTGKSMLMESLVSCHFNFTRLTGIVESSPFNFSSLVFSNACYMDEIKITAVLFEQWKLIAGGQDCSTDVKYHDKCDISNCVLYTASNYDIDTFLEVPGGKHAVHERTAVYDVNCQCDKYFFLAPHTWEYFWKEYNCEQ